MPLRDPRDAVPASASILTTTRTFTMLTTLIRHLPDLTLPDTLDFELELHIHVER